MVFKCYFNTVFQPIFLRSHTLSHPSFLCKLLPFFPTTLAASKNVCVGGEAARRWIIKESRKRLTVAIIFYWREGQLGQSLSWAFALALHLLLSADTMTVSGSSRHSIAKTSAKAVRPVISGKSQVDENGILLGHSAQYYTKWCRLVV